MTAMMAYAKALRNAGIENADVFADALQAVLDEEAKGRQQMQSDIAEMKKGIETLLHRMEINDVKVDGRFKELDASLRTEMAGLRTEMKSTALDLSKSINGQVNRTIAIISGILGLIFLISKFGNGVLP